MADLLGSEGQFVEMTTDVGERLPKLAPEIVEILVFFHSRLWHSALVVSPGTDRSRHLVSNKKVVSFCNVMHDA